MIDTKALREKVLDLAIRGKLVPQDPNDEPASVLLERIRAEKEQMVKEGKLKPKDIKNDTIIFKADDNLHYEQFRDGTVKCIEDEIPFELPQGWAWVRLQAVCLKEIKRGKAPKYAEKSSTLVFAQKCNTKSGLINISLARYLDETNLHKYPIELFTQYGDIIINSTGTGTLGRVGIFEQKDDIEHLPIIPDSHITTVRVFPNIVKKYMYLFLKTHQSFFESSGEGSTNQKELRPDVIKSFIVAIPPFNEQKSIVKKFETASEIINQLDAYIDNVKGTITVAKSKILDLAIRGKLVPQNPNDVPASVLLERIRAEKEELIKQGKIKRDKKESVIFKGEDNSYYRLTSDKKRFDADIPFEIPESWCWTTLPSVSSVELGKTLDKVKNTGSYHPYLRSVNVQWGYIDLSDLNEMKFEEYEIDKYSIKRNDLLICEGGDVGRCCIWERSDTFLYQNALHRVRFYADLEPRFYLYVMMLYESLGILKNISTGVTIKHLTGNVLSTMSVPLPPLNEQKHIVTAIETAFSQLEEIANSIS